MNIIENLKKCPRKIGNYDLITNTGINAELTLSSLVEYFNHVKNGALLEGLVEYDNHNYRYSLRIRGRGDGLTLYFEKMRIVYDNFTPVSAITELEIKYVGNVESSFKDFISWVRFHTAR